MNDIDPNILNMNFLVLLRQSTFGVIDLRKTLANGHQM